MVDKSKAARLAAILLAARRAGVALDGLPDDLLPTDSDEADACQFAVVDDLGPVGAWKVMQIGDKPGSFGPIPAKHVSGAPCTVPLPSSRTKIEIEMGFRIGRDLDGRADGRPYDADDVVAAIEAALPVFEIVESRLPAGQPALATRADSMSNWGLVFGTGASDWRDRVRADLAVRLRIDGVTVVETIGGHPSGTPSHALPWLANALVAAGRPLRRGQIVTTGAFGGMHPVGPGAVVEATIEGFAPITMRFGPMPLP